MMNTAPGSRGIPDLSSADLLTAIRDAENLLASSREGTEEGEFPAGSAGRLRDAVERAREVQEQSSGEPSVLERAVHALYDACTSFECSVGAVRLPLVDPAATRETRYLYLNLTRTAGHGLLFGMHDSTGYGVGWSDDDDRSDVKSVCSDYPAVYSEDLTGVFHPIHRARMRYRLSSAYRRGGVLTLCWHQLDPDGRGFYARDVRKERIVATILPGGTRHADYRARLQVIAGFLKSLRGPAGESIPVIFRPYHEHTGDWFWWGVPAHATTDEFVHLWQWTVRHMHQELNVHNTLWALSPPLERVGTEDAYSVSYPGDPYVDIFGMDAYFPDTVEQDDIERFRRRLRVVVGHARARNKLAALTEVGQENLRTKDWFTRVLLDPLKSDPVNRHIVYSVVWRNASATHHFAPYPGHPAVPDFLEFFRDPFTIFGGNIPEMYRHPDKGAGGSPGTIAVDGLAAPAGRPAEEKGTVRLVSLASSGPRGDRGPYER